MSSASVGVRASKFDPWAWRPPGVPDNAVNVLNPNLGFNWQVNTQTVNVEAEVLSGEGINAGLRLFQGPSSNVLSAASFVTVPTSTIASTLWSDGGTAYTLYEINYETVTSSTEFASSARIWRSTSNLPGATFIADPPEVGPVESNNFFILTTTVRNGGGNSVSSTRFRTFQQVRFGQSGSREIILRYFGVT